MGLINSPPNAPVDDQAGSGALVNVSRYWRAWFVSVWYLLTGLTQSGTTAQRPTDGLWTGRPYFDTTLGYEINYNGTIWVRWDGAPA